MNKIKDRDIQSKRGEIPFNRPVYITENAWQNALDYWEEASSNIEDEDLPTLCELFATIHFYALGFDHGGAKQDEKK